MDLLCKTMRERYDIAAIAKHLRPNGCRISGALGVADAGPHRRRRDRRLSAYRIREDASMNLAAVADMRAKFPDLDLVLIESGGDQSRSYILARTRRSHDLRDRRRRRRQIPSKGGPGITRSAPLVINKIDLAPHVGASLEKDGYRREKDARRTPIR